MSVETRDMIGMTIFFGILLLIPLWILFSLVWLPKILKKRLRWGRLARSLVVLISAYLPMMPDTYMRVAPHIINAMNGGIVKLNPVDPGGVLLIDRNSQSNHFELPMEGIVQTIKIENFEIDDILYDYIWYTIIHKNNRSHYEDKLNNFQYKYGDFIIKKYDEEEYLSIYSTKGPDPKYKIKTIHGKIDENYFLYYRKFF